MTISDDLLVRARNLERYPFESATMAEAGRIAAKYLREAANAHKELAERVHDSETCTFRTELSAACGYLRNALIDLETGAPRRTAIRTIEGGLKRFEEVLKAHRDSDGTASAAHCEDNAVPLRTSKRVPKGSPKLKDTPMNLSRISPNDL